MSCRCPLPISITADLELHSLCRWPYAQLIVSPRDFPRSEISYHPHHECRAGIHSSPVSAVRPALFGGGLPLVTPWRCCSRMPRVQTCAFPDPCTSCRPIPPPLTRARIPPCAIQVSVAPSLLVTSRLCSHHQCIPSPIFYGKFMPQATGSLAHTASTTHATPTFHTIRACMRCLSTWPEANHKRVTAHAPARALTGSLHR